MRKSRLVVESSHRPYDFPLPYRTLGIVTYTHGSITNSSLQSVSQTATSAGTPWRRPFGPSRTKQVPPSRVWIIRTGTQSTAVRFGIIGNKVARVLRLLWIQQEQIWDWKQMRSWMSCFRNPDEFHRIEFIGGLSLVGKYNKSRDWQ